MWNEEVTESEMNPNKTNLIVNYLPQMYTDEEMYALFATIGNVINCKIVRDKATGYSYGFGFVEFATPHEAQAAIASLNGYEIENKRLRVALARPRGENTTGANLYVRNIPHSYDEDSLKDSFIHYGNIVQVRILLDHITGMSRGVGFVLFEKKVDADTAMNEMNGQTLPGGTQPLAIKFADDNSKKVRPPTAVPQQPPLAKSASALGYGGGYGRPGAYGGPRAGGPMRVPAGGRMRYNPMSAGPAGGIGNGYSAYSGGYTSGYGTEAIPTPKARALTLQNPVHGASFSQFGGGDALTGDGVILFVYNIGEDATESDLWNLFSPYGTINKVNVIWDHAQNKCKGYGFVTMSTLDEANYAIEYLNGFKYKTAPLQVSIKSDKK